MNEPRPARPDEARALRDLVRAAYAIYIPRLGHEPAPMLDDYAARIAAGPQLAYRYMKENVHVAATENYQQLLDREGLARARAEERIRPARPRELNDDF